MKRHWSRGAGKSGSCAFIFGLYVAGYFILTYVSLISFKKMYKYMSLFFCARDWSGSFCMIIIITLYFLFYLMFNTCVFCFMYKYS